MFLDALEPFSLVITLSIDFRGITGNPSPIIPRSIDKDKYSFKFIKRNN